MPLFNLENAVFRHGRGSPERAHDRQKVARLIGHFDAVIPVRPMTVCQIRLEKVTKPQIKSEGSNNNTKRVQRFFALQVLEWSGRHSLALAIEWFIWQTIKNHGDASFVCSGCWRGTRFSL